MLEDEKAFRRRLLRWYDRSRRDLPWRVIAPPSKTPDPYRVLVSETMLQQTQVATVIPYFERFLARFPTLADLSAADEQHVLRLWQGLGYYSRARNLQAAARRVVQEHGGVVPSDLEALLALPGIGRYTAGAIASIAFNRPAPILDGNVIRVLCRLDNIGSDPREPKTRERLWDRATQLVPARRPGDFNSGLMELGATICTPRNPQCLLCPVREHCAAFAAGSPERLPVPKKAKPIPLFRRQTYCICKGDRWLIEQRPAKGRWAGMWQFITIDPSESTFQLPSDRTTPLGSVSHALTHRRYEFDVFTVSADDAVIPHATAPREWLTLEDIEHRPLPRPHVRIMEMLRNLGAGITSKSPATSREVHGGSLL